MATSDPATDISSSRRALLRAGLIAAGTGVLAGSAARAVGPSIGRWLASQGASGAGPGRFVGPPCATPRERRELLPGLYIRDDVGHRIALTFDDVPRAKFAPLALDWLADNDLRATFFIQGNYARVLPDLVRRIVDEGHELGNHSWAHKELPRMTRKQIHRSLDKTQDAVDTALGYHYPLTMVRPPFGAPWIGGWDYDDRRKIADVLAERGSCLIFWQRSSRDTLPDCDPDAMVARFTRALDQRLGGVWVWHPTLCAKRAFPRLMAALRAHPDTEVALVSELIATKYGTSLDRLADLPTLLRRGKRVALADR